MFLKWEDSDGSLSFYRGLLSASEDDQFWKAQLLAIRGGIEKWNQAIAILEAGGWRMNETEAK